VGVALGKLDGPARAAKLTAKRRSEIPGKVARNAGVGRKPLELGGAAC
jgi:hypothetical protein